MPGPDITPDELVAVLKDSPVPTVLVEGDDDIFIYRRIEESFPLGSLAVIQCGGRNTLLETYKRREEFATRKTIFVADADLWLFTGIPLEFREIVFTTGYSIENDLFKCGCLDRMLSPQEAAVFDSMIEQIITWYAFEIEEHWAGRTAEVSKHINEILQKPNQSLDPNFLIRRGFRIPQAATKDELMRTFRVTLRGKTLLQIYMSILNDSIRGTRYNDRSLCEIALLSQNFLEPLQALVSAMLTRRGN